MKECHECDCVRVLTRAIYDLTIAITFLRVECIKSHCGTITKQDLDKMEHRIMTKISESAARLQAFSERQAAAIDSAVVSLTGLTEDIAELNRKITELQNSPGTITPEDQALLDAAETQADALAVKAEAVSAALKTLDEQTPPVVPVPPAE